MKFYKFDIDDYRRDTGHLTLLEHGIYRQLLDTYYISESPLTLDMDKIMRTHNVRNADEKQALCNVLKDFFVTTDDGYRHYGCEQRLSEIYQKSESAQVSAIISWIKRHAKKHKISMTSVQLEIDQCNGDANALQQLCERIANGMLPITHNPKPKNTNVQLIASTKFDQFWDAFQNKKNRDKAFQAWIKLNPDDALAEQIIAGAKKYVQSRGDVPKYWKHAQGWLNDRRWEDEDLTFVDKQESLYAGAI